MNKLDRELYETAKDRLRNMTPAYTLSLLWIVNGLAYLTNKDVAQEMIPVSVLLTAISLLADYALKNIIDDQH